MTGDTGTRIGDGLLLLGTLLLFPLWLPVLLLVSAGAAWHNRHNLKAHR